MVGETGAGAVGVVVFGEAVVLDDVGEDIGNGDGANVGAGDVLGVVVGIGDAVGVAEGEGEVVAGRDGALVGTTGNEVDTDGDGEIVGCVEDLTEGDTTELVGRVGFGFA